MERCSGLSDQEPTLQERDGRSDNESQSNASPLSPSRVVEVESEGSNEAKREAVRRALGIAELFELSNSGVLTLGGLAHSFGCKSIGEFFHAQVVPWMQWVQKMTVRLNMVPTPERLDWLLLDGARAASFVKKIQENKKLWAYIQDYLK